MPEQMGFKKHNSTQMSMLRTRGVVEDFRNEGQVRVFELFIDFTQAFDKVPHNNLVHKLKQKAMPAEQLQRKKILLNTVQASLDGELSVQLKIGVAQGGSNSLGDFIIFINDLLQQIKDRELVNKQEYIGGYADDLKFYTVGYRQLKRLIQFIDSWSTTNGMIVNKKKSGIMKLSRKT